MNCKIDQNKRSLAVVILAAGKGTRMESKLPKVLHKIGGIPMISHIIHTAMELNANLIISVLGYKYEMVKSILKNQPVKCVLQKQQLGTAHAVLQCKEILHNFNGNVLVLSGDVPLIKSKSLEKLLQIHNKLGANATILSADIKEPKGYGRIIRDKNKNLLKIIEEKDATRDEKTVKEINSGIYVFESHTLFNLLPMIGNNNSQKEYYLPDVISLIKDKHGIVAIEKIDNFIEIQGINDIKQLKKMDKYHSEI